MDRKPPISHDFKPLPRTLTWLAGLLAIVEVLLTLADKDIFLPNGLRDVMFSYGAFWSVLLQGAEPVFAGQSWSMFVSHAFLHGNLMHMAMNTAILLALGRFISDRYGNDVILPLFVAGAIGGAIVFALLSSSPWPMVGASGAVFAYLGVWIMWDWNRHREYGLSTQPIVVRVIVLAVLNVGAWIALDGGLAWEAHLGGFIMGVIAGEVFERRETARARQARADQRRKSRQD